MTELVSEQETRQAERDKEERQSGERGGGEEKTEQCDGGPMKMDGDLSYAKYSGRPAPVHVIIEVLVAERKLVAMRLKILAVA